MKKRLFYTFILFTCLFLTGCGKQQSGFSSEDVKAVFNGKTLDLDADVSQLFAVLGDAYQYSEQSSCYYPGMDKTYTYPGVTVVTYPTLAGAEHIVEIKLTDDTYATSKGAKVGMSRDQIEQLYGTDYQSAGILLNYQADEKRSLSIAVPDDVVEQIRYIFIP